MDPIFRVVVYSHDTFGLGHLTRSTRIAAAVTEALPRASVLILTGSPVASRFSFPERIDYIKLPSVVKVGPDVYASRELRISARKIRKMRSQLILDAVRMYGPELLLVDNVPLGMKGEMLPTLQSLRRDRPQTRIHLNMRDILDTPEIIRAAWEKAAIPAALAEYFDAINVFGLDSVFDAVAAYGLPPKKTEFMGYIAPHVEEIETGDVPPPRAQGKRRILVTTGGGGDGEEILHAVGRMQAHLGPDSPYQILMVTGPLIHPDQKSELKQKFGTVPGVEIFSFVKGIPRWMNESDLVISMGGYNTLCEVLTQAKRSIVVPRTHPRREQEIRARAFESLGLVDVLGLEQLDPKSLAEFVANAMSKTGIMGHKNSEMFSGISRFKDSLGRKFSRWTGEERGTRQADVDPGNRKRAAGGRRLIGIALLALGAGLTSPASAGLHPGSVEISFGAGHDDNLLNASDAEIRAFDESDPGAFFAVDDMADAFSRFRIGADWALGKPFGRKSKLKSSFERVQYIGENIKSESGYSLSLQTRVGKRSRLTLGSDYRPQIYGRHRLDKDGLPGDPRFRAEIQRRVNLGLEFENRRSSTLTLFGGMERSWRDYNDPFAERDRKRLSLYSGFEKELSRWLSLKLQVAARRSRSSNEPDLGKDLSNREWLFEPALSFAGFLGMGEFVIEGDFNRRHYTSEIAADWNHRGRVDWIGSIRLQGSRDLSPELALELSYARGWRTAKLDSGQVVAYDEEGSFSENVFSLSLNWRRRFDS